MARRRTSRLPVFVTMGVLAAALAGGAWWIQAEASRAKQEEVAAAKIVPTLPRGRLLELDSGLKEARYLALDDVRRGEDGVVGATILRVSRTPTGLEGGAAMESRRESIDCAGQRIYEGQIGAFDADGKLIQAANGYSGKRGRPAEREDAEVAALCKALPKSRIVANVGVAQRETQAVPEGFEAIAEARPEDPALWARLCAAGARGRWRPQTPDDCDRAVKLNPGDKAVRLDRGFLKLALGKTAAADADFRAVIAEEPQNGSALFGHSLALAIRGDLAGSRTARIKALEIDPGLPDWIERSYRFRITRDYRSG